MKTLVFHMVILCVVFLYTSGIRISFHPFKIEFPDWIFGTALTIGIVCFVVCLASMHYKGKTDGNQGYDKGFKDGTEYVLNLLNEKFKEESK